MARLLIEPVGIHWLYNAEPGADLCAHGGIRVILDGATIFEAGLANDGYTLSTAALHLLRTLERDYDPDSASSGQLVPCCGHIMAFDNELGEVVNMPCPNGIEWRIRHDGQITFVALADDRVFEVSKADWIGAVRRFSEEVRAFYFATPRVVQDEMDATWHAPFVAEWNRRHEAVA